MFFVRFTSFRILLDGCKAEGGLYDDDFNICECVWAGENGDCLMGGFKRLRT